MKKRTVLIKLTVAVICFLAGWFVVGPWFYGDGVVPNNAVLDSVDADTAGIVFVVRSPFIQAELNHENNILTIYDPSIKVVWDTLK